MKWPQLNLRTVFHDSFEVSIFIKAFDGILEIIGAGLLFIIQPTTISRWVYAVTTHELSHDPNDWLANHLIHFAQTYSTHTQWFGALYLLSHGVIKVVIVVSLLQKRLWAYPTAIIFFIAFGLYQIYRYTDTHAVSLIVLTVLDIIVIALTWIEYGRLKGNYSE